MSKSGNKKNRGSTASPVKQRSVVLRSPVKSVPRSVSTTPISVSGPVPRLRDAPSQAQQQAQFERGRAQNGFSKGIGAVGRALVRASAGPMVAPAKAGAVPGRHVSALRLEAPRATAAKKAAPGPARKSSPVVAKSQTKPKKPVSHTKAESSPKARVSSEAKKADKLAEIDKRPVCKKRPDDNRPRGGGGGGKRFIPWC